MEPELRPRPAFTVLGITTRINPMQADYPAIWDRQYGPRANEVCRFSTDPNHYGLYFGCDEPGLVDFMVGRRVEGMAEAPPGLVLREVPAGTEAVFTCGAGGIGGAWQYIYSEWLPGSDYEHGEGPDYERFPEGFDRATGTLSIHVPVRRKA